MYMPNYLVHHVPTTTASSSPAFCIPSTQCVTFLYSVLPYGTQFYLVELRSTIASPLASQLCKYICMYITCLVLCAHLMAFLPQNQVLKAHSNMWA